MDTTRTWVAGGLASVTIAGIPLWRDPRNSPVYVRLSGTSSPYSGTEVQDTPLGTWETVPGGRTFTFNLYADNNEYGLDGDVVRIFPTPGRWWRFPYPRLGSIPAGKICFVITTCTGGSPPAGTFTVTDDLGDAVTPISTTDTSVCFDTVAGRSYTVCVTITGTGGPWLAPPCQTFAGPATGTRSFYTNQAPNVISIISSDMTCTGGLYQSDDLTFRASCPFSIKPNGIDQPGYYGSTTFTIDFPENLGPYSPCYLLAPPGATVYDLINGLEFYLFIPATAPGMTSGGYQLEGITTNGSFPGSPITTVPLGINLCTFGYVETAGSPCGDSLNMPLDGIVCDDTDSVICNCFPNLCLNMTIACDSGLAPGAFSLTWSIAS